MVARAHRGATTMCDEGVRDGRGLTTATTAPEHGHDGVGEEGDGMEPAAACTASLMRTQLKLFAAAAGGPLPLHSKHCLFRHRSSPEAYL